MTKPVKQKKSEAASVYFTLEQLFPNFKAAGRKANPD